MSGKIWRCACVAFGVWVCAAAALPLASRVASAGAIASTSAQGAVVMEATSGRVLFAKNSHAPMPMASTTKVMTAWLAIRYGNLQELVKIPSMAVGVEGSSMYLEKGETLTLEDLLYGLMLNSGNDAAVAIAIHLGGSVEGFAAMMNAEAEKLGMLNTHFVTPNGLQHKDHYTSAYDLGLLSCLAMQDPEFRKIVGTESKQVPWLDHPWPRTLKNKNKILWQYEGGNGVKTGYTTAAGRCLVASAERDGMQLVSVALNCGPMFEDCMALMDDAFARYRMVMLVPESVSIAGTDVKAGVKGRVMLRTDRPVALPLSAEEVGKVSLEIETLQLTAPVAEGTIAGSVTAKIGEWEASASLVPVSAVERRTFWWRLAHPFA